MGADVIIWIVLVGAGVFVLFKIFNAIGKSSDGFNLIIGILVIAKLGTIYAKHHKNEHNNVGHTQSISEKTETSSHPEINGSDEDSFYYFINFINTPPFNNSVKLEVAKCILDKPDSNSCDIKCIKVNISNELHKLGVMPEKDCNRGTKQENTVKITYMSETYYVSSSSSCIEHVTTYEAVFAGKKFVNQSCSMVKTDPDFLESSMDQTDYLEMIQVKLRNFDEFERLYEKYYKE